MRSADEALYRAKAAGRNTYRTVATDQESSGQTA
jgi:PleD family two-component response regulator